MLFDPNETTLARFEVQSKDTQRLASTPGSDGGTRPCFRCVFIFSVAILSVFLIDIVLFLL
jgi:hypothetical protein